MRELITNIIAWSIILVPIIVICVDLIDRKEGDDVIFTHTTEELLLMRKDKEIKMRKDDKNG